jgi:hypothetical protein
MKAAVTERRSGRAPQALGRVVQVARRSTGDDDTIVREGPVSTTSDVAAATVAAPETAAEASTAVKRWPTVVCAVLAAIGFAGSGYFVRYWLNDRTTSSQANQVRTTTSAFVTALTNFNPGNIDTDFAKIQSLATGTFANQARQYFGSSIRNQLIAAHAGSRGQVRDLFVESLAGGQADVFVVVDQSYTNSRIASMATDTLRLDIGLTDTSAGWRVSSVNVLQSPSGFVGPTPTIAAPGSKSK